VLVDLGLSPLFHAFITIVSITTRPTEYEVSALRMKVRKP